MQYNYKRDNIKNGDDALKTFEKRIKSTTGKIACNKI